MSKKSIFDYAKAAAQAELKIIELLDGALRDEFAHAPSEDVQKSARPRQGQRSSG